MEDVSGADAGAEVGEFGGEEDADGPVRMRVELPDGLFGELEPPEPPGLPGPEGKDVGDPKVPVGFEIEVEEVNIVFDDEVGLVD